MPTALLLLLLAPRVAFLSERGDDHRDGLYEMAADGSGVVRLVPEARDVMHFVVAPGGDRIAFVCDPGTESFTLHVLDRATGRETPVHRGIRWAPAWSADGARLAFMNHTSKWHVRLTAPDAVIPRPPQKHVGGDGAPAWSPDGSFVAFQSNRDDNLELYRYDVATAAVVRLTETPAAETGPEVSPDGRWIAYERGGDVWVMRADGTGPRNLTHREADDAGPVWSPDSARIAFTSERDGDRDVCVVDLADGTIANLTAHPAADGQPAWSPDGTRLLFTTNRDGNDEVYVMDADGGAARRLTDHPGRDHAPKWIP